MDTILSILHLCVFCTVLQRQPCASLGIYHPASLKQLRHQVAKKNLTSVKSVAPVLCKSGFTWAAVFKPFDKTLIYVCIDLCGNEWIIWLHLSQQHSRRAYHRQPLSPLRMLHLHRLRPEPKDERPLLGRGCDVLWEACQGEAPRSGIHSSHGYPSPLRRSLYTLCCSA